MLDEIQVGSKGLPLRGLIVDGEGDPIDVTGGTFEYLIEGPKGVEIEVSGLAEDGPAGKVVYVLELGDGVAEIAGEWRWQVHVTLPGGFAGYTKVASFKALHNLG